MSLISNIQSAGNFAYRTGKAGSPRKKNKVLSKKGGRKNYVLSRGATYETLPSSARSRFSNKMKSAKSRVRRGTSKSSSYYYPISRRTGRSGRKSW